MASTVNQLNALANDSDFRQRTRVLVLQTAATVYGEGTGVTGHAARAAYAVKLLQSPGLADQVAQVLVTRTNVVAGAVSYDFDRGAVVTDVSDSALLSQLSSDWSMLAGV